MGIVGKIQDKIYQNLEGKMTDDRALSLPYIKKVNNDYVLIHFIYINIINYRVQKDDFDVIGEIYYNLNTDEITIKEIKKNFEYSRNPVHVGSDYRQNLEAWQNAQDIYYSFLNKLIENIVNNRDININFDKKTFELACGSKINAYECFAKDFIENYIK